MMVNYSEWHTERAPQGKKVNYVEETSSLSDKIDTIMAMLANDRTHVYPNNVPLASLVAQEEHVDVNFIRNNFAGNNYRPFPSNGDNSYLGRPKMPSEERIFELERATKNFMQAQHEQNRAFTKTMEEQSALLRTISHQLEIFLNCKLRFPKLKLIFHYCLMCNHLWLIECPLSLILLLPLMLFKLELMKILDC
jgi:hypothetical protein